MSFVSTFDLIKIYLHHSPFLQIYIISQSITKAHTLPYQVHHDGNDDNVANETIVHAVLYKFPYGHPVSIFLLSTV